MKNGCLFFVALCTCCVIIIFQSVSAASWMDSEHFSEKKTCKCSCGVARKEDEQRIVGGRPTEAHEYPWMTALAYKGRLLCGGSLINDRYVLTAAHCVQDADANSTIRVILGAHKLDSLNNTSGVQKRNVSKVIRHPDFVIETFNNDVALLKLDKPVQFTRTVSPICLPQSSGLDYAGRTAVATGWGRLKETRDNETSETVDDIYPSSLMQVEVDVLTNELCRHETKFESGDITDNMMCAGTNEKDACQGDSGGPLHLEGKDKKTDLIGIVSFGIGCARGGFPGVYTRVNRYLKWVANNTADACYCRRRRPRIRPTLKRLFS